MPKVKQLQERVVFHVLQQYARSGVFKKMYIVSNSSMEEILGGVPVTEYYDRINNLIVNTIHMINVYKNTDSIINTFSDSIQTARMATFGVVNVEDGEKKLFYPLEMPREYKFYYSCDRQLLEY